MEETWIKILLIFFSPKNLCWGWQEHSRGRYNCQSGLRRKELSHRSEVREKEEEEDATRKKLHVTFLFVESFFLCSCKQEKGL